MDTEIQMLVMARMGAAEGLGKLPYESSLLPLKQGLNDTYHRVAKAAQESIEKVTAILKK